MYYADIEHFKSLCGYDIEGFWYPRVTRIVDIKAKPALYHFYANMESFKAGEEVKQRSASEGTQIHNVVEKILIGEKPTVPPSVEPSIRAFLNFLISNNIQVDPGYIEHRLVNYEHRYAGTLDAVAFIGGKLGILDIKTSQDIYRDYNLQTAAYMAAMKDKVKGLETRWILRIDQDKRCLHCSAILRSKGGREKIKTQRGNAFMAACNHEWGPLEGQIELKEFPYWQDDFEAFLGAKKLWEWENDFWLKQVGYL